MELESLTHIIHSLVPNSHVEQLTPLHGDASNRRYLRASLSNGSSVVVMCLPNGAMSASEEITNITGDVTKLPFIDVANYLSDIGIRTPRIIGFDQDQRVMTLEDLGDTVLADKVKNADADTHLMWYQKALDLLVHIQTSTRLRPGSIAFRRSFDATLLNWEFDHFREYLIEARIGKPMAENDKALFEEETRAITQAILDIPYGFTHRDFQSRNIMVLDTNELALIDFQDALRGPVSYDVVSLLRDSYIQFDENVLKTLLHYYHDNAIANDIIDSSVTFDPFMAMFQLVTAQRKMKDAGRFVYIEKVKGNPNYLSFITPSLGYVKEALTYLNKPALMEIIGRYVPEWNTL